MTGPGHDEFAPNAAGYALEALDAQETRAFEAHLATCEQCRVDVAEYRRVTAGLGLAIEPVAPPESLRAKTISRATGSKDLGGHFSSNRQKMTSEVISLRVLLAAASVVLAIGAGIYAWSLRTQLASSRAVEAQTAARAARMRDDLASVRQDAARFSRIVDVLTAPDVVRVDLAGTTGASAARGRTFWSPTRGVYISADQLPALTAGRIYQLWLVLPNQNPISAGLLNVAPNGSGSTLGAAPNAPAVPRATVVTFAITEEPAAGSPGPSTPILLAGSTKTD